MSGEGPVRHGAGMPHVLTSHHHFRQNICRGHCQSDGSQQICQKQVKTAFDKSVQLHDSAEGAGDEKEEETTTCECQRSNFSDTPSHAKSVMTHANSARQPRVPEQAFLHPVREKPWGRAPCCPPQRRASEAGGWHLQRRIHVVAGEAVGVLDDPFLVDIHEDLLATDGTDAVREVLGGHP